MAKTLTSKKLTCTTTNRQTRKQFAVSMAILTQKLPSGHTCEPIATQYKLKTLTRRYFKDDNGWPYGMSITWACFSRRYRYKDYRTYEKDLNVLLTLCDDNTIYKDETVTAHGEMVTNTL